EALWDDFSNGWTAIYEGYDASLETDTPQKRLPAERETKHIRCHFQTILTLWYNHITQPDDLLENQRNEIFSFLPISETHRDLIRASNPGLANRIM
ncbi:MAG: hypothetical protein HRU43_00165, partial [Simkaniaceae bacterium]|nr:hypothetical protein [Simkaniaceae bacterium]